MDKLTLAHDWAMKHGSAMTHKTVIDAWAYADAMQAEADKRKPSGLPEALIAKDKDGNCLHFHREFGHKKCMDCGASLEEWQPDWGQAPGRMNWFSIDKDGTAAWYINKPTISATEWVVDYSDRGGDCYMYTSNFGYTGDWQDSLRERPHGL